MIKSESLLTLNYLISNPLILSSTDINYADILFV